MLKPKRIIKKLIRKSKKLAANNMAINKALINIAQSYAPKWGTATEEDMHKPLIGSRRLTQMAAFPATRKGYEINKL